APPLAEGNDQQQLDKAMASIDQLRMSDKLDSLLPQPVTPTFTPGRIAHNDVPPAPLPAPTAR
ncbi:hypothetical protein HFP05_18545, partial [Rhodanobacter denitrificans]|nr:hypothetical protein [Rhodanobacter denitrificans]